MSQEENDLKSTPLPCPGRDASREQVRAYVASLPRDLDGDPYVVSEHIGPWKVSHCCGASAKGVCDGPPYIVCRRCYREFDGIDAAARLHDDDPVVTENVIYRFDWEGAQPDTVPRKGGD